MAQPTPFAAAVSGAIARTTWRFVGGSERGHLIKHAGRKIDQCTSVPSVFSDVVGRELWRIGGRVFGIAALTTHSLEGTQDRTQGRIELRTNCLVGCNVPAPAGRPQAFVLQDRRQGLAARVVDECVPSGTVLVGNCFRRLKVRVRPGRSSCPPDRGSREPVQVRHLQASWRLSPLPAPTSRLLLRSFRLGASQLGRPVDPQSNERP